MSDRTLNIKNLQLRNDTAANWTSKNPVLLKGEFGIEIDTNKVKVGNGVDTWTNLAYITVDISGKADKATTLAGYGITDAYTKTQINTELGKKQNNLTEAQLNAVNSGITSEKVGAYDGYADTLSGKADSATTLAGYGITDAYTKTQVNNITGTPDSGKTLQDEIDALESAVSGKQPSGTYVTATSATSVETSLTTSSNAKVPTSKAVATYVTGRGYLVASDIANKADKATTLSGYGITDAKIDSGTITLGSNTITPLTAASTLDATKVSGTLPASTYTNTVTTATTSGSGNAVTSITATNGALTVTKGKSFSETGHTHTLSNITDAGTAASKNVGTSSGNVPVLDSNGKLSTSVLPALAISDTFVVASQSAMLALTAQVGDIAVRTDTKQTYILQKDGASTLSNWVKLETPADAVSSVNGKTGAVSLSTTDISEGTNLYYTATRATSNFNTNIAATNVSALKDGANVLMSTDTYSLDCGNA